MHKLVYLISASPMLKPWSFQKREIQKWQRRLFCEDHGENLLTQESHSQICSRVCGILCYFHSHQRNCMLKGTVCYNGSCFDFAWVEHKVSQWTHWCMQINRRLSPDERAPWWWTTPHTFSFKFPCKWTTDPSYFHVSELLTVHICL